MPDFAVLARVSACLLVFSSILLPANGQAQSRREGVAAQTLAERMDAAESRYREALVKVGNNDPDGITESNAALEDMEDVVTACGKQRGCSVPRMLATYKRLLKAGADARAAGDEADASLADDDDLPTGNVPDAASAASLLSEDGERFVRMVQFNPAVQAGIRRWLTDMRPSLMDSHENYQYMRHLMSPAFKRSGLPEALLFGILAKESNGKAHAGSRAGAVGPMQFMPATGRRFGLGVDATGFDTRYDPRASADAAAAYLNERFAEFGNDIEMWLAAYNGGEGRAARVYREFGGRKFWDVDVYNQFPPETKDYVPMVIAAAWLYLHPDEYGVRFPKVDARPATFTLERPASIYELTICLGNSGSRDGYMRALRNLNPRYEPDAWIPPGTVLNGTARLANLYERRCAKGERAELARQLVLSDARGALVGGPPKKPVEPPVSTFTPDASKIATTVATGVPTPPGQPRVHRVSRGDTLVSIARQYACDAGALARANGLEGPRYAIRSGQRLRLEGCAN
ncbi:transglycosylase SLT domain-containing protein [Luteimonas vadosa]|uniref:Transglycosylase SLT domain-containing protein n=1 Tax=Luteimonas vadosa TaxID=1165507 RepID=A0ABP9E2W5_9GAMM